MILNGEISMKKKDKYKIFNYAKEQYSKDFNRNYAFKHLSKKELYKLLEKNKHSSMCEWDYCCCGLYCNCWQEPYEEGNWNMTQENVNDFIRHTIDKTAKICRKDSRMLYCETNEEVNIVIIARDIFQMDYLITFTNEEI